MSRTWKDAMKWFVKDCSSLDVFGEASMDVARRHGWNACGKMCHIVWVGCALSAAGDGFG